MSTNANNDKRWMPATNVEDGAGARNVPILAPTTRTPTCSLVPEKIEHSHPYNSAPMAPVASATTAAAAAPPPIPPPPPPPRDSITPVAQEPAELTANGIGAAHDQSNTGAAAEMLANVPNVVSGDASTTTPAGAPAGPHNKTSQAAFIFKLYR